MSVIDLKIGAIELNLSLIIKILTIKTTPPPFFLKEFLISFLFAHNGICELLTLKKSIYKDN